MIKSEALKSLRDRYPEGTRVELIRMDDPYTNLMPGDKGTVTGVDDTGTVFVSWDKGSSLGLVWGEDQFRSI